MAQLKDLIVNGDSKFLGDAILDHNPTADMEAATKAYVDNAIDGLPAPMQFKGSLGAEGTGSTITSLPAASTANAGFTYKVITEGTYITGETAKVGDMYISNGTSWVLIPSGDDLGGGGTVTSVGITNGGGLSVSGGPITTSGSITVSHADTSSQASVDNSGLTFIQDVSLDTYGHVTGLGSKEITKTDITGLGIPGSDTNTTYELSGALSNHTFTSTLTAGGSGSGTSMSALTLAAGGNVSLTDDTATKKITIAAANTTYTFADGTNGFTVTPSGGTAQTVSVKSYFVPDVILGDDWEYVGSGNYVPKVVVNTDLDKLAALFNAGTTIINFLYYNKLDPESSDECYRTSADILYADSSSAIIQATTLTSASTIVQFLIEFTANDTATVSRTTSTILKEVFKGYCYSPANIAAKGVTSFVGPKFELADLKVGAVIFVTFDSTNSAAVNNLTLNVNSTGAKSIKYLQNAAESDLPTADFLKANMTYRFVYTGTYWICDINYNANTTYTFTDGTNGFTVTPSGGTAQTVTVTPSITNNITGSGTSGSLAKFSGTNTLTDGPAFNTSATAGKYLSETGSWTRPLNGIFKGTCSTPAGTATKAVVCPEFTSADLVTGAVVFVTFTNSNSAGAANLNLNVNSTGAKRLKYMRNTSESDLPGAGYLRANMTYRFVYTGSVWVCDTDYDTNTYLDVPRIRNLTVDSNAGSLYRYELCMFSSDTTIVPYNKTNNAPTTYTKAVNTCAFDPFRNLVYYNTTNTVSAGTARADNNFCLVAPFDCRYSFNIQNDGTAGSTALTTSKPVYIKAKYNIASKTATLTQNLSSSNYLEKSGIVQALPTTDPNTGLDTSVEFYIYIFVGIAYSLYQICLFPNNRVYAWNASRSAMKEFDARGFIGASNSVTIGNAEYLLTRKPLTITDDGGTTTTYYIAELTAIQ